MNIGQIKDFYKLKELNAEDIAIIYKLAIEPTQPHLQKLNKGWISSLNLIFQLKRTLKQKGINDTILNALIDEAVNNTEEDFHGKLESDAVKYIESILNEDIGFYQTDDGNIDFTYFICIQYMRTNKVKSAVLTAVARRIQSIDFEKIWNILSHIYATNMGWTLYAERGSFHMFLLKNQSQKELITGDQPVINTYYATGLANTEPPKELEFYYPVSPRLAVLITKNVYNSCADKIILKEDEVDKYNLMMIENSHSQIYATSKEVLNELIRSGKYKDNKGTQVVE
jgi:hypothetical protein